MISIGLSNCEYDNYYTKRAYIYIYIHRERERYSRLLINIHIYIYIYMYYTYIHIKVGNPFPPPEGTKRATSLLLFLKRRQL